MKQIIAMGGGGFSMEPENLLLDSYILKQSKSTKPKICFLPTASGDSEGYVARFYKAFGNHPCEPSHLSLFKLPTCDLEGFLLEKDVLYVGGGNTKSMLALWREWGLDKILKKAWNQGIVLAGLSAGAICWFEEGLTDSFGDQLDVINGLGFIQGSHSPHYDSEEERRGAFQRLIETGQMKRGYGADDGVALHFCGTELHKAVSSRPFAKAYFVTGKGHETKLETNYLGK